MQIPDFRHFKITESLEMFGNQIYPIYGSELTILEAFIK